MNDLRQLLIYVWAGAEQSITDDAFDQWHTHLHACIQATANALLMCPVSSATQLSHIASLIPGMACSLIVSVSGRQGNWTLWTRLLGLKTLWNYSSCTNSNMSSQHFDTGDEMSDQTTAATRQNTLNTYGCMFWNDSVACYSLVQKNVVVDLHFLHCFFMCVHFCMLSMINN